MRLSLIHISSASWNLDTGENLLGLATQASGTAPIQVKNVKSITQLPLTGAAGITMLDVYKRQPLNRVCLPRKKPCMLDSRLICSIRLISVGEV